MHGRLVVLGVVSWVACAVGCEGDGDSGTVPYLTVTPTTVERRVGESFDVRAEVGLLGSRVADMEVTVIEPSVVAALSGPTTLSRPDTAGIYVFECLAEGSSTLRFRGRLGERETPFDTKEVAVTCLDEDVTPGTCALQGDFRAEASFTPRTAGATAFDDVLLVSFEADDARFEQPSTGDVNDGTLDGDCNFAVQSADGRESYDGSCDAATRACTAVNVYMSVSGDVSEYDVAFTLAPPLRHETVPDGTSCGTEVTRLPVAGRQSDILQIAADTLVVANGSGGISYLDVSDPGSPGEIALLPVTGAYVGQIDVQGVLLAGGDGPVDAGAGGTVVLVDHSDPAAPIELGRWDPASEPSVVEANGGSGPDQLSVSFGEEVGILYVALEATVVDLDVGDPRAPRVRSTVSLPRGEHPVLSELEEERLYYSQFSLSGSMTVFSWSDGELDVLGDTEVDFEPLGLSLIDGFLYAAGEAGEVAVFDSAGGEIHMTDLFDMPRSPTWTVVDAGGGYAVASSGNAGAGRLDFFDVSDPSEPVWVAQSDAGTIGGARSVVVVGDHAYVAAGNEGVRVIDVAGCRP